MIAGSLRGGAVIDGLMTLAVATFDPDVMVIDGPRVKKDIPKKIINIGWDPNSPVHVIARRGESDLDGRMAEMGEVACYISTRTGNANMKQARDMAVDMLTLLEAAIRADREHLSGACDLAEIGPDAGIWQYQTAQNGASVGLPFSVSYEAYI